MSDDNDANHADKARMDQSLALAADVLPPLWRRVFDNLRGVGFNESDAMLLLRTHVHGAAGGKMEK